MRKPFSQKVKADLLDAFGWCCALCGCTGGVSIHHIDTKTTHSNCILNGIPLCSDNFNCHKNYHDMEYQKQLVGITYNKLSSTNYQFSKEDLTFYNGYR